MATYITTPSGFSGVIKIIAEDTSRDITKEIEQRSHRVVNVLRAETQKVLTGARSGRMYYLPNTRSLYQASAPGEPPAVRTGVFRSSWDCKVTINGAGDTIAAVESKYRVNGLLLGAMLEEGTKKMAPRPYKQKALDAAMPKAQRIYNAPYR